MQPFSPKAIHNNSTYKTQQSMTTKSRILTMLECIDIHIKSLRCFIHEDTFQAAVAAIKLEATELCEALREMESQLVTRLAIDVDRQYWQEVMQHYAVSLGHINTPESLRDVFNEIADTLLRIDEAVIYPSDEFLSEIYTTLLKFYDRKNKRKIKGEYNIWRSHYSSRLLPKRLRERMEVEKEQLENNIGKYSYYEVFDSEKDEVDTEGVARYVLSCSHGQNEDSVCEGLDFNNGCCRHIYQFIVIFDLLKTDLKGKKKTEKIDKIVGVEDELEPQVKAYVEKVHQLVSNPYAKHLTKLWQKIYKKFRHEIATPGSREKFKEFSKKKLCCIIGHLKSKGVYRNVTDVEVTKLLEGSNNGMRKYVNSGLVELIPSLKERIEAFISSELQGLAA